MQAWRAAWQVQLQEERDLAAARGEDYAKVIDIGLRWGIGTPLPHLISNRPRTFLMCLASQPDPHGGWHLCEGGLAHRFAPVAVRGDGVVGLSRGRGHCRRPGSGA